MQPVRMFHAEWCQAHCTQRGQLYLVQDSGNDGFVGFVNARCEKSQWPTNMRPWLQLRRESLPVYVNAQGQSADKSNSQNEPIFLLRGEIPVDPETTEIVLNKVSVSVHPGAAPR
jgi:hypothetical protein